MNKILILLLALLMVPAAASNGFCESRFTDGFRGIAWDTTKDQLPDLGLSKKTLKNIYKKGPSAIYLTEERTNLSMDFEGIPLLSIFLRFNDQVFYGFDMVFKPEYAPKVRALVEKDMQATCTMDGDDCLIEKDGLSMVITDRELMVEKKK